MMVLWHTHAIPFKNILNELFISILYTLVFYLNVYLCEDAKSPTTGIIDSYELPYGCWELNLGPPEEQLVLLTAEPALQPLYLVKTPDFDSQKYISNELMQTRLSVGSYNPRWMWNRERWSCSS
jgi:hypothetical protein